MRLWWLSVVGWLSALILWFFELSVLVIARRETSWAEWKLWLLILLWLLIVFSYFHAIFTPPAAIPPEYHIDVARMPEKLAEIATERKAKELGLEEINYCSSCKLLKPSRAHHCKKCGHCILRMDHHCPILQSCVHHGNHKFHLLYLFWPGLLAVYALFICSSCIYGATARYWLEGKDFTFEEQFITSAEINAATILISCGYLLFFQVKNISRNRTIIEESKISSVAEDEEFFDYSLGSWQENVCSLLGPMWSWLLPISSVPGNGLVFFSKLRTISQKQ